MKENRPSFTPVGFDNMVRVLRRALWEEKVNAHEIRIKELWQGRIVKLRRGHERKTP